MRKTSKILITSTAAALALMVSAAQAQESFMPGLDLTLSGGTTGVGLSASLPITSSLNGRVGFDGFNYNYSGSTNSVNYDYGLKLQNFSMLLDYYPFANGFRLSGGLVINKNRITANGRPYGGGYYTLNGNTYPVADVGSLTGRVDFNTAAPYLGFGYATRARGFGFMADLGVLFQGAPHTTLMYSGCEATALTCAAVANDVAAEQGSLNSDVRDFRFYPVAKVGVSYTF
jgi:hypothetical protein